jgi:hypothetical protein
MESIPFSNKPSAVADALVVILLASIFLTTTRWENSQTRRYAEDFHIKTPTIRQKNTAQKGPEAQNSVGENWNSSA